jgi:hypothetical protein
MGAAACDVRSAHTVTVAALGFALGLFAHGKVHAEPAPADSVNAISAELCADMKRRRVMNPGAPVGCERLRLVRFGYLGFDGQTRGDGEIVVMDALAERVMQVFAALRNLRFPIASAKLMNQYNGDDDASMAANNTSSFNVRTVEATGAISMHAYGLAVDLNPVQNPYVQRMISGRLQVEPRAGAAYLTRKDQRPGMAEAVIDVFADHGLLVWGGYWNSPDYQHFQVSRSMADQLARLSPAAARALFERRLERYVACVKAAPARGEPHRRSCAMTE